VAARLEVVGRDRDEVGSEDQRRHAPTIPARAAVPTVGSAQPAVELRRDRLDADGPLAVLGHQQASECKATAVDEEVDRLLDAAVELDAAPGARPTARPTGSLARPSSAHTLSPTWRISRPPCALIRQSPVAL
jgi:hypothetical protein